MGNTSVSVLFIEGKYEFFQVGHSSEQVAEPFVVLRRCEKNKPGVMYQPGKIGKIQIYRK